MEMIKFNEEEKKIGSINGALALRGEINRIVDELCEKGYDNLCWLGIGELGHQVCKQLFI